MGFKKVTVLNLKEKATQHWFSYFWNCPQVLKIFYDWPVKYYFDDFGTHVYDYSNIRSSLDVYIFHKGII